MNLSRTNIISILLVVVLAGGGIYYFFFFNKDTGSALSSTDAAASVQEQTFITLVGQLDPIVFDTSLLADPRFTSRTDIRTTIVPEASGRTDPFAPIAGASAATVTKK